MSSPVTWLPMLTFTPPSLCLESARTSYLQDDRNNPRPTDRLSLLSWNPGPARGPRDAFIGRVVGCGKALRCRKLQITCNTLRSMQDSLSHSSEIARSCSTGTSLSAMSSPSITTLPQTRVMQIGLEAVVASYEAAPLSQTDRLAECLSSMSTAWTWPNATRRADNARRAGMTENGTTPDTQSVDSQQSGRSHDQGQSCSNSDAL